MQTLVERCPPNDPDMECNLGCVLFKVCVLHMCVDRMVHKQFQEGHYEEACTKFSLAMQKIGYKAGERESNNSFSLFTASVSIPSDICYNISLCYYKMRKYAGALKYITEIIERGIKDHPGTSHYS